MAQRRTRRLGRARWAPTSLRAAALWAAVGLSAAAWSGGWLARPTQQLCRVEQVLDGDSLRLRCRGKPTEVRLYCIDAPEYGQEPWGKQSRIHLRKILPDQVELRPRETDRFGRVVGELYSLGKRPRLINLEQVEGGQAAVYRHYCTDSRFLPAQQRAKLARRGIWSKPGEQQTPWVYRRRHAR